MKHQRILDSILAGKFGRAELLRLRKNAASLLAKGDKDAATVISAIDESVPTDTSIVFMGFCPGATLENRLDIEWKEKGICTFIFLESEVQVDRFNDIWPGDLIVLKKRHKFGESMRLYGHGRARAVRYDENGHRYLEMDWSKQETILEVPLMGCNSTVDVRSMAQVTDAMPKAFFDWLK
jgi:hypothetical protein